ncbi:MAG: hypothetical protein KIT62_03510 [Cyclobacteriaceae bacterium]|nr:hypothetical protein [Cyclobacteriaceae bacterium]
MMMGGFGSLKAMNDTIKQNREMLKAGKKGAFEKSALRAKVSENLLNNDKKLSEQERIKHIQAIWDSNRKDDIKRIIVLIISSGIAGFLVWLFLLVFKFRV